MPSHATKISFSIPHRLSHTRHTLRLPRMSEQRRMIRREPKLFKIRKPFKSKNPSFFIRFSRPLLRMKTFSSKIPTIKKRQENLAGVVRTKLVSLERLQKSSLFKRRCSARQSRLPLSKMIKIIDWICNHLLITKQLSTLYKKISERKSLLFRVRLS